MNRKNYSACNRNACPYYSDKIPCKNRDRCDYSKVATWREIKSKDNDKKELKNQLFF